MKTEIEQQASFEILRYAQCWEDADILVKALDIQPTDTCLSIASAGENSFSILASGAAKVIAIDMNPVQLHAVRLRMAAYQHLTHEQMLKLHGATSASVQERAVLYQAIRFSLPADTAAWWDSQSIDFFRFGYGSVGKFERYFALFREKIIPLIHSKKTIQSLFNCSTLKEQNDFFDTQWNTWRWRALFKVFFSRTVMGLMGRDPAFFNYVEGSVALRILARTELAFREILAKDNPYLDWILHGKFMYSLPHALREENFLKIRQNLDKLHLHLGSIESYLADNDETIHKFNLSDIFEYMSESAYETLYQRLITASTQGGRFAYWNMLAPRYASCQPQSSLIKLVTEDEQAMHLFIKDKAFFYSRYIVEQVK